MITQLALIAIVVPIAFFLIYFLMGSGQYERGVGHYKILNILTDFPYEMTPTSGGNHALKFLMGYFAATLLTNLSMFLNFYEASPQIIGFLILSTVLTLAYVFFTLRIHTVTASLERSHLGRFFLMGLSLFALTAVNGIIFINLCKGHDLEILLIVLSSILFALALAVAIILVNPRLKTWAKLEKVVEEDGSSSLKRPKPFVLAFSEWLVIFIGVLSWLMSAVINYLLIR